MQSHVVLPCIILYLAEILCVASITIAIFFLWLSSEFLCSLMTCYGSSLQCNSVLSELM